jgi:hypothetical protein
MFICYVYLLCLFFIFVYHVYLLCLYLFDDVHVYLCLFVMFICCIVFVVVIHIVNIINNIILTIPLIYIHVKSEGRKCTYTLYDGVMYWCFYLFMLVCYVYLLCLFVMFICYVYLLCEYSFDIGCLCLYVTIIYCILFVIVFCS